MPSSSRSSAPSAPSSKPSPSLSRSREGRMPSPSGSAATASVTSGRRSPSLSASRKSGVPSRSVSTAGGLSIRVAGLEPVRQGVRVQVRVQQVEHAVQIRVHGRAAGGLGQVREGVVVGVFQVVAHAVGVRVRVERVQTERDLQAVDQTVGVQVHVETQRGVQRVPAVALDAGVHGAVVHVETRLVRGTGLGGRAGRAVAATVGARLRAVLSTVLAGRHDKTQLVVQRETVHGVFGRRERIERQTAGPGRVGAHGQIAHAGHPQHGPQVRPGAANLDDVGAVRGEHALQPGVHREARVARAEHAHGAAMPVSGSISCNTPAAE